MEDNKNATDTIIDFSKDKKRALRILEEEKADRERVRNSTQKSVKIPTDIKLEIDTKVA